MSQRRSELLAAAVTYLVTNGVADVSLRPMAAAIGTSARLLVFHFGSKERLLRDVLTEVQARLQASFAAVVGKPDTRAPGPMQRFWQWATVADNLPYFRLLYEVHLIALQNPRLFAPQLGRTSGSWIELIEPNLPKELRSKAMATLCAAVFDGLVLELLATGDRRRTTAALEQFVSMLAQGAARPAQPGSRRRAR